MIDFLVGLVLGSMFSPFWMMLYNNFVKPLITKEVAKVESDVTPPKA